MINKIVTLKLLLFIFSQSLYAQYSEYEIKAAYLKSISLFVEWPNDGGNDSTFVITVIGDNPFKNYLETMSNGTTIHQKKIKINYTKTDIPLSNIVFISNSEKENLEKILNRINSKSTLIIADTPNFAQRGVHLNFYKENRNILFEINLKELTKTELTISSRLLQLARIIN